MIVWLASYPKSGNTLLRSILSSYFYSKEGEFSFNNLNYISQFPLTSQFMSVGIDIDNDEEVFKNFINVQSFLNQEKNFSNKIDWDFQSYGKLWTYNLNYFDFLNQKEISKDNGLALIYNYIENSSRTKVGIESYPVSIRIMNWIKFISNHQIQDKKIDTMLAKHLSLLNKNLEYHLLGNHILENAFALLFGAYYFGDETIYRTSKKLLESELDEQILFDGAHFELSPMYHQLLLTRLLDYINLVDNNP